MQRRIEDAQGQMHSVEEQRKKDRDEYSQERINTTVKYRFMEWKWLLIYSVANSDFLQLLTEVRTNVA